MFVRFHVSNRLRRAVSCAAMFMMLGGASESAEAQAPAAVKYLHQGWTQDERVTFYFTSQGSQLVPYDWFLALEQAGGESFFHDSENLAKFGFLPHPKDSTHNKHGLPIGFVKDDRNSPTFLDEVALAKEAHLGKDLVKDQFLSSTWIGLTCAACHTAEIKLDGTTYRIDGGPALADFEKFLDELVAALDATELDDEKMTRFARRVLAEGGYSDGERDALRKSLRNFLPKLRQLVLRGRGTTPYGFGRLDAFGAILNEICETSLGIPSNHYPADAPVSYPVLWNTTQLDWVQWNGSVGNPIARNVGEVLGVFGQLRLKGDNPDARFASTAHILYLDKLEQDYIAKLRSPVWPAAFGKLDADRVAAGKSIYAMTCAKCHFTRDINGKFPSIKIGEREFIRTSLIPISTIGTDPQSSDNFAKRTVDPGDLAGLIPEKSPYFKLPRVPRGELLTIAVGGVVRRFVQKNPGAASMVPEMTNFRPENEKPPNPWSYKARPLNGIWASAPYLHNGSVPTLYDLLLPEYQRPTRFYVGNREFDPVNVGYVSKFDPTAFEFRVHDQEGRPIVGNSNRGHSGWNFTHYLSPEGQYREFTEAERRALIEYLKSLR
jgi:hypothetical protein